MNNNLPIFNYRGAIVDAVNNNNVVIITAETGSGKSTQVCQYLYDAGYEVVVTEPRRLAARTLAERVSDEINEGVGNTVGYRTAFERCDSEKTHVLFATDGLQLVRSLTGTNNQNRVLIIDEVHEWNLNIETLIAWTHNQVELGWETKVVIMSATLETEKLCKYFGNAIHLAIPGRCFNVEKFEIPSERFVFTIKKLVEQGKNVLAFLSGKKEIDEAIKAFGESDYAVLLPLHGELSSEEQQKCFANYCKPKVVFATNVAQTSVTVPDIDAVVDLGEEKRIEAHDGVEGLFLHDISKADSEQRRGRAGRTKPGEYYLCSDTDFEKRDEYPIPEIQRSILDQVVLRLAAAGINATSLKFFHQPKDEALNLAHVSLSNLGALDGGKITEIGKKMAKMPISAKYARMILEADRLGVVDDVIDIAAILESGSLIDYRSGKKYSTYTDEDNSDLLAELDIWKKLKNMGYVDFKDIGINGKAFFKIKELRKKLLDALRGMVIFGTSSDRVAIKKSIISGMVDHLYVNDSWLNYYVNGDGIQRKLDKKSCINMFSYLIVGNPITIQTKNRWNCTIEMNLITMATAVEPSWLKEVAPQFIREEDSEARYNETIGCYVERTTRFRNIEIKSENVSTPDHPDAQRLKNEWKEEKQREEARNKEFFEWRAKELEYWKQEEEKKIAKVGEKEYIIHDSWEGAYITFSSEELFAIPSSVKNIRMDNGQFLTLKCGMHSANNVPALVDLVEKFRVKCAWEAAKRRLPNLSSTKEKVIREWIPQVGKIEIVKNKDGKEIYGFKYLSLDKNSISIKLTDDEAYANSETGSSLKFLFERIILNNYPEKKFGKEEKSKKANKELFDEFVAEIEAELTAENFESQIKEVDEVFNEIMK